MPDLFVSIDVDDHEAQAYFDYAGYHARDMRIPLSQALIEIILPGVEEQFVTEGARSGGWRPLDDRYLGQKLAAGYPPDILIRTGAMRDEFLGFGPRKPWRITMHSLDYSVVDQKAAYHQQGGWEEGHPPQREIVVWTRDDQDQLEDIFTRWLDTLRTENIRRGPAGIAPSAPSDIFIL